MNEIGRVILAALLMLEGLASGFRFARFVPILAIYPPSTAILLVARAMIGALAFASGWMLWQRRPFGSRLAGIALLASAVFMTFEVGFRLVPTSLFPSYRWPAVALYWAYALAATTYLARARRG